MSTKQKRIRWQDILALLPATALEIAAELECEPRAVHNNLWCLQKYGKAKKTDRRVPNGTLKQGAKSSPLWTLAK